MNELLRQISNHLEFFGYSVVYEEGILKTTHGTKPFFWVFSLAGGAFFRTVFGLGAGARGDRNALLDFLNQANEITVVSKYRTFENWMAIEAWYPDSYSKKSFGTFLDQYLADINAPAGTLKPLTDKLFRDA
jgi:hypothetical protein